MSVTFYDPADPPHFELKGFEGGIWLNFSNANGLTILYYMGLNHEDLYGEMDGADFRRCVHRGIEMVKLLNIPQKTYILDRYEQMMHTFSNSEIVKWD